MPALNRSWESIELTAATLNPLTWAMFMTMPMDSCRLFNKPKRGLMVLTDYFPIASITFSAGSFLVQKNQS